MASSMPVNVMSVMSVDVTIKHLSLVGVASFKININSQTLKGSALTNSTLKQNAFIKKIWKKDRKIRYSK